MASGPGHIVIHPGVVNSFGTGSAAGAFTTPVPYTAGGGSQNLTGNPGPALASNLLGPDGPSLLTNWWLGRIYLPIAVLEFATVDDAVVTPLAALLLNGHLVWTGTGTPTGFPASGVGTNTVIAEDFVNPIRLTRANSLVLQLGYSSNPVVTTGNVVMYSAVGGNFVASEGTLAYTVVDVPGVRSL
jgi:hypothetical protein